MATVQVCLDVEGEIYPELYAMLVSLEGVATRAERMRQLASCGLIWEHLRLQGPTRVKVDLDPGNDKAGATKDLVASPSPSPAVLLPAEAAKVADDAEVSAANRKRTPASLPRDLPILYDAVESQEIDASRTMDNSSPATHPSEPVESAPQPVRRSGPRPRLMRMKEKGLFNND